MNKNQTLPTFGELVPGEGGHLGAIMRGSVVDGIRQADYALIVPNLPSVLLPWGEYGKEVAGAGSLTDGLTNTQAMIKAKCPSALHIQSLVADGHSDLYLPARAEYWALRANVPELFEKEFHWTSTQTSRDYAFAQDFEDGSSNWYHKSYEFRVRPVRRIHLYHSIA